MKKTTFILWLLLLALSVCFRTEAQETRKSKPEIGKYVNAVKGLSFQYPLSWTVMTPEEVTEKTKGQFDTKDTIVFVVNEKDPDKNVNIKSFPVPKDSATTAELQQLEGMIDQQYPQQFRGFKKVSAKIITVAGVKALEYAQKVAKRFVEKWKELYPEAVSCLSKDIVELLTFFRVNLDLKPSELRTTNAIERRFREVRRRTRPMGVFSDRTSVERIMFAVFTYENKKEKVATLFPLTHNN